MTQFRRLFPLALLTVVVVLLFVGDRSPRAQSPSQPTEWALWSPYWTTEDGFTSTLLMKNNRGQETLRLTVALYFMDGSEYELAPIELGPRQTVTLNLNSILEALPGRLVTSREGSAEVRFAAPNNAAIMGSIAVSNPEQGIAWNFRLYSVNPTLSVAPVRGVFWLRDEATDGFVAAQNASAEFITITPRFDIHGTKLSLALSQLAPGQTLKLELRDSLRSLGLENADAGGLEFVYDGPADAVKAHGVTFNRRGFSAEFDFLRYSAWEEEQTVDLKTPRFAIGLADPALGLPGQQIFEPTLVLHNFNRHELAVNLAFGYREGASARETQLPLSLAAGDTMIIPVPDLLGDSIPANAHWASLEISYTDRRTGLGAALVSVTQEGEHSIRSVLNWVHGSASEGWYWRADGDHNTLIGILNTDAEEARVAVSLDYYVDGARYSYDLPDRVVPPRASELINIGDILAANVADRDGDQIPAHVTFGGYRVDKVGRRINKTLITETLVFNRRTKNYLTFYNTCCAFDDISLSPGALIGLPGGGGQLNVEAFDFCSGNRRIVNESAFFFSNNTNVATVGSNTGAVSMVSPGSTDVNAELEYFQMEFFVDPCVLATFAAASAVDVVTVTLNCPSSVTRGQSANCTVSVENAPEGASITYSNWRFTDGTNTVNRSGTSQPSSWQGTMVTSGTVSVDVTVGSTDFPRSANITVNNRSGFAFSAVSAVKQTNPFVHSGNCSMSVPTTPAAGNDLGFSCLDQYFSFVSAQVTDNGPNHGFWYVQSASDSFTLPTSFDYIIAGYLDDPASEFAQKQCGNYDPATNTGFISHAQLLSNTLEHESGTITGHYAQYKSTQDASANNVGIAVEKETGAPTITQTQFQQQVRSVAEAKGSAIATAMAAEACNEDVRKDPSCTFRGFINWPPYEGCP